MAGNNDVLNGRMARQGEVPGPSFSALLDALPMPAYLCDGDDLIVAANTKAMQLWGEELRVGEDDKALRVSVCIGSDKSFEVGVGAAGQVPGEPSLMDDVAVVVESNSGQTLRALASVTQLQDGVERSGLFLKSFRIMQPSETEQIFEPAQAAGDTAAELRRSESGFALLVGSIIDYAVFMLDPKGIISNWNAGAERIKGYRAEEIIGSHFSRFYTPEDRAEGVPAMALATAEEEGRYSAEGWRLRKDGTRFWASVVIDRIVDHGTLIDFAKVTRDITERREAETALIESEFLARGVIDTALVDSCNSTKAG